MNKNLDTILVNGFPLTNLEKELVEALMAALNDLDNELDQSTDDNRKDYLVETIEKATVALTKAGVLKDK